MTEEEKQLGEICDTLFSHDFIRLGAEGETTSDSVALLTETYKEAITEAWRIINVLNMCESDKGESYPRALQWLHDWDQLKPR